MEIFDSYLRSRNYFLCIKKNVEQNQTFQIKEQVFFSLSLFLILIYGRKVKASVEKDVETHRKLSH
jgi:hypothetical protein